VLPVSGTQQPEAQSAPEEQILMQVAGAVPNPAHVVPSQQRTMSVPHAVSCAWHSLAFMFAARWSAGAIKQPAMVLPGSAVQKQDASLRFMQKSSMQYGVSALQEPTAQRKPEPCGTQTFGGLR
jgi:hypothetical protein